VLELQWRNSVEARWGWWGWVEISKIREFRTGSVAQVVELLATKHVALSTATQINK
jgi:hypothetical protein